MAKHWAIAVGINTYSSFQTLSYAQNDAEAFCRELIESDRVAPANCLLMTTASAFHLGQSTFPLKNTLLQWLQWLVEEAIQPEDQLWFFFSGYGIHHDGQDYLMAIDGDPSQPQETGIAMTELFRLLKKASTDRILLLLDMNHNEGSLAVPVGMQTAKLAQENGIATVQSCEPQKGQFSRKAAGLNHGFFTAALLPALQQPELRSLQMLTQDIKRRMEELSDHYWRPEQTPLTVGDYAFDPPPTESPEAELSHPASGSSGVASGALPGTLPGTVPGTTASTDGVLFSEEGAASVTPLDINYVSSTSTTGLGDEFTSVWNWSAGQDSEGSGPEAAESNGAAGSSDATGAGAASNGHHADTDTEIDPYAAVWEEDHGQSLDESQINQNAIDSESEELLETQPNASVGPGGDNKAGASSWHWADWVVASTQAEQNGSQNGSNGVLNGSSPANYPPVYPEPAPISPDLTGPDLAAASQGSVENADLVPEFSGSNISGGNVSDDSSSPLGVSGAGLEPSPTDQPLDIQREGEYEGNGGAGLVALEPGQPEAGALPGDSPQTIDVEPLGDWSEGYSVYGEDLNGDFDDDGGLPIIELDPLEPEDESAVAPNGSEAKGALPKWFSLRLLGAAGLVLLTALGLLGWFRTRDRNPTEETQSLDQLDAEKSGADQPNTERSNADQLGVEQSGKTGEKTAEPAESDRSEQQSGSAKGKTPGQNKDQSTGENQGNPPSLLNPTPVQPSTIPPTTSDVEDSEADAAEAGRPEVSQPEESNTGASPGSQTPQEPLKNIASASLLQEAQANLQPTQASSYNQAIATARRIPSNDPNYKAARQQMDRWSQEMMGLAEQRAKAGDYLGAIAAARLVPSDLFAFPEAQVGIAQWQAPAQLQHAKALIQPGRASSYNQAIAVARGIPAGIRVSAEAETLRQDWSREILNIAQERAGRGQWSLAIAAAQLVPPDMDAFEDAQAAIAQWQTRLN